MGKKPGAPSSDRDPAEEERHIEAVKDLFERVVNLVVGDKQPDFAPIWNSIDYRGLPPDAKKEVDAWVQKEFQMTPPAETSNAPAAVETPESNKKVHELMELFERAAVLADIGGATQYDPVWLAVEAAQLPEEDRRRLEAWATAQGITRAGTDREPKKTEAMTLTPRVEVPARKEKPKPAEREQKYEFIGYRFEKVGKDEDVVVVEDYRERQKGASQLQDEEAETEIVIPSWIVERLEDDPSLSDEVIQFCEATRRELDKQRVPKEKRDQMITEALEERFAEVEEEEVEPTSADVVEEPPQSEKREPVDWTAAEVRRGIIDGMLIVENGSAPTDAKATFDAILEIARKVFMNEQIAERAGKRMVDDETLRRAVQEALVEKYRAEKKLTQMREIERLMPIEALESEKETLPVESAAPVAEKKKTAPEERLHIGREPILSDGYLRLRGRAETMPLGELLEELRSADRQNPDVSMLLADIEYGRIGAGSEARMVGMSRPKKDKTFFDAHPLLDKRNFALYPDGSEMIVISLDRLHVDEAFTRALLRIVNDTMGVGAIPDAEEHALRERVAVILGQVLREGHTDLGVFDDRSKEMRIRDISAIQTRILEMVKAARRAWKK